jgi:hypothetical protein
MSINFKRLLRSIQDGYIVVMIASLMVLIGIIGQQTGALSWRYLLPWVIAGLVLAIALIIVKTYLEYQRNTYDPDLALKYVDEFFNRMKRERYEAAKCLLAYRDQLTQVEEKELAAELAVIDPVLDLLDDLGFFLKGDQASDKVLNHFFYYWIRGYWIASKSYIAAWRTQPREHTRWGNIEKLFLATKEVEISSGGNREEEDLEDPREIKRFLTEEVEWTEEDLRRIEAPPGSIRDQSIQTPSQESPVK